MLFLYFLLLNTVVGNTRMVETSRRQNRMEVSSEGDQGPEGAVAPLMDGMLLSREKFLKTIN